MVYEGPQKVAGVSSRHGVSFCVCLSFHHPTFTPPHPPPPLPPQPAIGSVQAEVFGHGCAVPRELHLLDRPLSWEVWVSHMTPVCQSYDTRTADWEMVLLQVGGPDIWLIRGPSGLQDQGLWHQPFCHCPIDSLSLSVSLSPLALCCRHGA